MASCSVLVVALCLLFAVLAPVANAGWIDPDTPKEAHSTWALPAHPPPIQKTNSTKANVTSHHTQAPTTESPTMAPTTPPIPREYKLVMSDEFNVPGRKFADGTDPKWTAMHKNDYTNDAQHFYHEENAYTDDNGDLIIKTEAKDTEIIGFDDVQGKKSHVTKHFRSAMLQTWNKFCFTGGVAEAEVVMPGKSDIGGLWPAFWLLGNLARHTYVGSSEHVWPWASTECTQKSQDAQLISGCSKALHWGMEPEVGRGSPEIDIFEVQPGKTKAGTKEFKEMPVGQPFMSSSYQVAPGLPARPGSGWWPGPGQWYDGLVGGNESSLNILFYGAYNHFLSDTDPGRQDYWSDAISFNRQLHSEHFETKHKYRLEWEVPDPENGNDGYLHWFLDDQLVLKLNGTSIVEKGLGTGISSEPSYLLLNTAVSSQWGFPSCPPGCPCKEFNCHSNSWTEKCGFSHGFCNMLKNDNEYKINYVRVWQDPNDPKQKVGCSTPERPTRQWIKGHEKLYKQEDDVVSLKSVQTGRGTCSSTEKNPCGGSERGTCTAGEVCECRTGWTGPTCLAHAGRDDIVWDAPDGPADVGFQPPSYFPTVLVVGLSTCAAVLIGALLMKTRSDRKDYAPVPNVAKSAGRLT